MDEIYYFWEGTVYPSTEPLSTVALLAQEIPEGIWFYSTFDEMGF